MEKHTAGQALSLVLELIGIALQDCNLLQEVGLQPMPSWLKTRYTSLELAGRGKRLRAAMVSNWRHLQWVSQKLRHGSGKSWCFAWPSCYTGTSHFQNGPGGGGWSCRLLLLLFLRVSVQGRGRDASSFEELELLEGGLLKFLLLTF